MIQNQTYNLLLLQLRSLNLRMEREMKTCANDPTCATAIYRHHLSSASDRSSLRRLCIHKTTGAGGEKNALHSVN